MTTQTAPVENVTLCGREIPIVLESWGYQELADEAWKKLRAEGWAWRVDLTIAYVPDRLPLILDGDQRLNLERVLT